MSGRILSTLVTLVLQGLTLPGLIEAERARLRRLHDEGAIGDEVMLRLDRELDLEEAHTET